MNSPLETEIKLGASPAMLARLAAFPALAGDETRASLATTYFDTEGGALAGAGATFRLRDAGGEREQTLKLRAPGGTLARAEWTAPATSEVPDAAAFPGKPRATLLRLLAGQPLVPVATARVDRTTRLVRHGASRIEVAFDSGSVGGGERSAPLCELELELREGHLADALALALACPLGPELRWTIRSKAERALALAADARPRAQGAIRPALTPAMNAARAFHEIGWSALAHWLPNCERVLDDGDPAAVHQARVALRRLRAAMKLFAPVLGNGEAQVLRRALATLARSLGPARELHVLREQVRGTASEIELDATALVAHLECLHAAATREAQAVLASGPSQRLILELALWLERGAWAAPEPGSPGAQPVTAFAAHALGRLHRKLRKHDTPVARQDIDARHRRRIAAKQLRYAIDFFTPLWSAGRASVERARMAADLARLQDRLGELNDMAVAASSRDALFAGLDAASAAELGGQFDALLASSHGSAHKATRAAQKALDRIVEADRWWKR